MRKTFEANGDPSPKSILVDEDSDLSDLNLDYPIIVKPTDRSGSRGIFKLYDDSKLAEAVKNAISESFEKKALIEEFAEGKEYSVEFISFEGKHTFLQMTEKFTTGEPHFIETGHLEPAPINGKFLEKVKSVISHALDSLGIKYGASHSEIKIDSNNNIKIIEIGGRMGGDCIGSDLVQHSTGYDFVKMVIDTAVGKAPDFTTTCEPSPVRSVFMFTKDDIEEYERIVAEEPENLIRLVDFHPENIGKTTDSSNRAGCYIVRCRK